MQRTEFSAKYFPGQILGNPVSYNPNNINISYRLPNPKAYLLASVGGLSAIHRSGLKSSGSSYSLPFLSIALYETNQFRNFFVMRCITKYSDRRPSPLVHGTRRRRRLLSPCAEYLKQDVNVPYQKTFIIGTYLMVSLPAIFRRSMLVYIFFYPNHTSRIRSRLRSRKVG